MINPWRRVDRSILTSRGKTRQNWTITEGRIELGIAHQKVLSQERPHFTPRQTDHEESEDEVDASPRQIRYAEL
jgi:hypothetical protein